MARAASRSSRASCSQRLAASGSGTSLIDDDTVMCRLVLRRADGVAIALKVGHAGHQQIPWDVDSPGGATKLDHEITPPMSWCIVEHDQKIDIGVRPVSPISHRTEENDRRGLELFNDEGGDVLHPIAKNAATPRRFAVLDLVLQPLHDSMMPHPYGPGWFIPEFEDSSHGLVHREPDGEVVGAQCAAATRRLRVGETFLGICTSNPHNGGTP